MPSFQKGGPVDGVRVRGENLVKMRKATKPPVAGAWYNSRSLKEKENE